MNKAILIVICDFLVSAMLSMMTGMVAGHSGGTGVGLDENTTRMLLVELENKHRELEELRSQLRRAADSAEVNARLRRLAKEIAANRLQRETLKKQLELTDKNTGELTPEQLKKLLDAEKIARYTAEVELKTKSEAHKEAKADLAASRKDASELRQTLQETARTVSEVTQKYTAAKSELASTEAKLAGTEKALEAEQRMTRRVENDLGRVSEALRDMASRYKDANSQAQHAQNTVSYLSGNVQSAEREAADFKGRTRMMENQIAQLKLNNRDALRRNEELRRTVQRTVKDLTETKVTLAKTQSEARQQRDKAVRTEAKLEAARQQLSDARKLLKTDVLELYAKASVTLEIDIKAKNVFTEDKGGGVYFLPVIDFNGTPRIAGHFSTFCGDGEKPVIYNRITRLNYRANPTMDPEKPAVLLDGPLSYVAKEPRIASLPAGKVQGIKPLRYLDRGKLRKRGFQQLVLFKNSGGKRDVVELDNRCFLDLMEGDKYLFIRNDSRSVRAGNGDVILTREGDFVGVVVRSDSGRSRVFVFPEEDIWKDAPGLDISGHGDSYSRFANGVKRVKDMIFQLEKK